MKKRLFRLLLTLALCPALSLGLLSPGAFALGTEPTGHGEGAYQHGSLTVLTGDPNCYEVTPESEGSEISDLIIRSGAHITFSGDGSRFNLFVYENAQDVVITLQSFTSNRPTQNVWGRRSGVVLRQGSSATILLEGENTIRAGWESSAIQVHGTASLTIDGEGSLNASVDNGGNMAYCAVIGSHYDDPCGNITINGGTIRAQSLSSRAAAIGTASWNGEGSCGTIALNGGTIHANAIGSVNRSDAVITGSGGAVVHTDPNRLKGDLSAFNGVIWNENSGTVYGNAIPDTLTLDSEQVLAVPEGAVLTVPEGGTCTVEGAILLKGTMENHGSITGGGQLVIAGGSLLGDGVSSITPGPCPHRNVTCIPVNETFHKKVCLLCGEELARETHTPGDFCGDCGYGANPIGQSAYYTLDQETKTLYICGTGRLWGYRELSEHHDASSKWHNIGYEAASVVIQEGITAIGEETFEWFSHLKELALPQSLEEIGEGAFLGCGGLRSVVIPPHVTSALRAFSYCSNLETLCAPEGLEAETGSGVTRLTYALTDRGAEIRSILLGRGKDRVTLPTELYGRPVTSHPHVGNATCAQPDLCAACSQEYTLPHSYGDWQQDVSVHWRACLSCAQESPRTAHNYDNDADAACDECGYERPACTVTFDPQGGSAVPSASVLAGGKAPRPADPAREGHTFGGWYADPACTEAWSFDAHPVTQPMTLYAKWMEDPRPPMETPPSEDEDTPTVYAPTVAAPKEGGSVSVSVSNPEAGDRVTVTPKPEKGYEVDKVLVTTPGGKEITVRANPDGTYSFFQPDSRVSIEVVYRPVQSSQPSEPAGPEWTDPFGDVAAEDWFYEGVRFVAEKGLFTGTSATAFSPRETMTRAMLITVLARLDGQETEGGSTWYAKSVSWAVEKGISDGTSLGSPITREQLSAMLYRYAKASPPDGDLSAFADADSVSPWAVEAMTWAVDRGILTGKDGGLLDPQGPASRAEAAVMLMRFLSGNP